MPEPADYQNVLAHLAAIVESAHDAVIGENLDRTIMSWNQGAERLFGFSSEEAIGQSTSILVPAHCAGEEQDTLQKILHGERVDHYDTVMRHEDGHLVDVSVTISPIRDAAGKTRPPPGAAPRADP